MMKGKYVPYRDEVACVKITVEYHTTKDFGEKIKRFGREPIGSMATWI